MFTQRVPAARAHAVRISPGLILEIYLVLANMITNNSSTKLDTTYFEMFSGCLQSIIMLFQ